MDRWRYSVLRAFDGFVQRSDGTRTTIVRQRPERPRPHYTGKGPDGADLQHKRCAGNLSIPAPSHAQQTVSSCSLRSCDVSFVPSDGHRTHRHPAPDEIGSSAYGETSGPAGSPGKAAQNSALMPAKRRPHCSGRFFNPYCSNNALTWLASI